MKEKLILIIAILSGVAAMFLTRMYLDKKKADLVRQFDMVPVIAAQKSIPQGTTITMDKVNEYLGQTTIPKRIFTSQNVTPDQLDMIVGREFQQSVQSGSPILWNNIQGSSMRGGNLASMVNQGERALSIPVDSVSSVTGLVEPNDHVDILGTFTFPSTKGDPTLDVVTLTILQNVTILATGKETSHTRHPADRAAGRRSGSYSAVTLLVTPKEAEMLVFAMQKGRLTLSLRSPADISSARDLTSINFNYLEKKVGEFNDARQDRIRKGPSISQ
jgi:pilus assembly protein CpaB